MRRCLSFRIFLSFDKFFRLIKLIFFYIKCRQRNDSDAYVNLVGRVTIMGQ
ncbi:hypothetical protein KsCSTR_08390 [Candidatus Kuenenia stuttgartiensis]|uniref:Uncharacterized protein n=1 Tax=Kuenenia stuttgartiensis TaxID=174633 RepID=Q1PZA3_KUEST|nr:hypothetical protein KsCSTR_08390 [Candidatus Kuenenia stuttgartiensis]CAJ72405.1 unknown protein [Candidatus Kuenenia stuttgartiensis]